MRQIWHGPIEHKRILAPLAELVDDALIPRFHASLIDLIIIEVSIEVSGRSDGSLAPGGLQWLQRIRREARCLAPALVYSFQCRESLIRQFTLLEEDVPGIGFLRAPFRISEYENAKMALTPMTSKQLEEFNRWHGGLQRDWSKLAHGFGHALSVAPLQNKRAKSLLTEWSASIHAFAPDQIANLEAVHIAFQSLSEASLSVLQEFVQRLDTGLCERPRPNGDLQQITLLPAAPCQRPPTGFDAIGIADDNGYETATILSLQRLGYHVFRVACNLTEARGLLQNAHPNVILADLNFPSQHEGKQLLFCALESPSVQLVIAVSHARPASGLPDGVEDCCGFLNFQSAERIHQLIWRRAQQLGISTHV